MKRLITTLFVVILLTSCAGNPTASEEYTDLDGKYQSLITEKSAIEKKLKETEIAMSNLQSEFDIYKEKIKPYTELSEAEAAVKKAEADAATAKANADRELEAARVSAEKAAIEKEAINKLAEMRKASSITLKTGQHTVGKHIPAGRYTAKPSGGTGNFTVMGSGGVFDLKVNEILGSDYGVAQVICELADGDTIEISSINAVVFTPEP